MHRSATLHAAPRRHRRDRHWRRTRPRISIAKVSWRSLDQLKRQAGSSNEQDVKLRALEREAKSQRDLLESWLAKYREASARDNIGASAPEARVISRGFVSNTASWPKKVPTVLIASLGMFTLAIGFILTGQLMSAPLPASASVAAAAPVARTPEQAAPVASPAAASAPPSTSIKTTTSSPVPSLALSAAAAADPSPTNSLIAKLRARLAPGSAASTADAPAPGEDAAPADAPTRPATPAPADPVGSIAADAIEELAAALGSAGDSGRRVAVVGARRNMGTTLAAISLARALAKQGRAVLVDLALESPNLSVIASDPNAPGLSELVQGSVSFGQIITRDRYSRVHLITVGKADVGAGAILASQRLAITLEALSRSYDYVVLDAGALPEIAPEKFARLALRAVLVADDIDGPATSSARERLLSAGFPNVNVLASAPDGPEFNTGGTRAAA